MCIRDSYSNVLLEYRLFNGDVDAGFVQADVVVESTYQTQAQEHAYLQPEAGVAWVRPDGRIEVVCAGQWMHEEREQIAHALGLPDEQILLRPGTRPLQLLSDADCQKLTAHGVNPLHAVRASVAGTAQLKTLARGTGAGPESSLLTFRRRQLLTINSIESGTRWARFEGRDRNTWPRLARQVQTFLLGLAASGAFGKGADAQHCEVVCDERVNTAEDVRNGVVHCLISLPTPRLGENRSFMLTHRLEGSTLRVVRPRQLPPGTRFTVREQPRPVTDELLEDTTQRRTLAQELFAPTPDQRPAVASGTPRPEAAAARRLDLNLIARLYGESERRGERF